MVAQLTEPGNAAAAAYLYEHAQQLAHLAQNRAELSATVRSCFVADLPKPETHKFAAYHATIPKEAPISCRHLAAGCLRPASHVCHCCDRSDGSAMTSQSTCRSTGKPGFFAAQADIEFPTGANNMVFLRRMITNAYANVSNVVLVVQPAGVADRPALLLNAHFDSTLGSAGRLSRLCLTSSSVP